LTQRYDRYTIAAVIAKEAKSVLELNGPMWLLRGVRIAAPGSKQHHEPEHLQAGWRDGEAL